MKKFTYILILVFVLVSCSSVPVVPDGASSTQLIQLGQDAMGSANYTAAETYYNAVIQRYGMDTATYVEAKYELGHLYMKQNKYHEAYACFSEILDIFENAEFGSVPAAYKKLSLMGIENIPEKYRNR